MGMLEFFTICQLAISEKEFIEDDGAEKQMHKSIGRHIVILFVCGEIRSLKIILPFFLQAGCIIRKKVNSFGRFMQSSKKICA